MELTVNLRFIDAPPNGLGTKNRMEWLNEILIVEFMRKIGISIESGTNLQKYLYK
jgi:hypothetical protein